MPAETHVEQGPMDRQEVFELIRDRLADILEIEPAPINEGDSFADDLDADSLALIELVEALEEELGERTVGFRIEDEDLEDLKTVRDAVDYVVAQLGLSALRRRRSRSTDLHERLGYPFADPELLATSRSPTGPGAPSTRATSPTSASSSSATPCSGWSSPTTSSRRTPTCPRASWPRSGRRS